MPRGDASKLRRRNQRKQQQKGDDIFGQEGDDGDDGVVDAGRNSHDFGPPTEEEEEEFPMPPGMTPQEEQGQQTAAAEDGDQAELLVKKKKKKKKRSIDAGDDADDDDDQQIPAALAKKSAGGIKSAPLMLLILMTGTTLLPALIFASDYIGNFLQRHHVLGQIGFRLGMGAVPRKRVVSFYEKHDPNKLHNVPTLLSKHYGDYPTLIKKLERKYHDYGYFLGWEQDEAAMTVVTEQIQEAYKIWLSRYWNVYAPQVLKTAARNIRYNIGTLQKKGRKIWRKTLWPVLLEPIFGVPKGAAAQKRKDAQQARKNKPSSTSSGTRRRNKDFRDDVDEE